MDGLMQNVPLTVDRIIDHAANWHGAREIVSRDAEGRVTRSTYAAVHADAKRVSNALAAEGIKPGDRVATMAWNGRSESHTSVLHSLIRISYTVFCLKTKHTFY